MGTTLVTGGAGFIGSNFVNLLARKERQEKIVVLDAFTYAAFPKNIDESVRNSTRFRLIQGNICDLDLVAEHVSQADRIVHFAAESHVTRSIANDVPFFQTDVMGTQTIVAAISRNPDKVARFVHISTSEVYGTAESAPMDETHPLNPCTPYAAAKAGADRLVYAYHRTYGIPTVIIRPFNNYGPRQHIEKVIPRFIVSALLNEPLTVHGDGQMTRDWIYVEDTCEAVYRALTLPGLEGKVINLGTGLDTSVKEIASRVLSLVPSTRSKMTQVDPRPGQVDRHISSTETASLLLGGWQAEVLLSEGLAATVSWYQQNRPWWERLRGTEVVTVTDETRRLTGSY